MHPTSLMIGLMIAFTSPKISATTMRVSTVRRVVPPVTSMPAPPAW